MFDFEHELNLAINLQLLFSAVHMQFKYLY